MLSLCHRDGISRHTNVAPIKSQRDTNRTRTTTHHKIRWSRGTKNKTGPRSTFKFQNQSIRCPPIFFIIASHPHLAGEILDTEMNKTRATALDTASPSQSSACRLAENANPRNELRLTLCMFYVVIFSSYNDQSCFRVAGTPLLLLVWCIQ